jgi:hypothetical protein
MGLEGGISGTRYTFTRLYHSTAITEIQLILQAQVVDEPSIDVTYCFYIQLKLHGAATRRASPSYEVSHLNITIFWTPQPS